MNLSSNKNVRVHSYFDPIARVLVFDQKKPLMAWEVLDDVCTETQEVLSAVKKLNDETDKFLFMERYGFDNGYLEKSPFKRMGERRKWYYNPESQTKRIVKGVWRQLNKKGIKGDDKWMCSQLERIKELECLAGRESVFRFRY